MEKVCIWPDGTWCYWEELEEMLTFMSDDFLVKDVTEIEDVESFVLEQL